MHIFIVFCNIILHFFPLIDYIQPSADNKACVGTEEELDAKSLLATDGKDKEDDRSGTQGTFIKHEKRSSKTLFYNIFLN